MVYLKNVVYPLESSSVPRGAGFQTAKARQIGDLPHIANRLLITFASQPRPIAAVRGPARDRCLVRIESDILPGLQDGLDNLTIFFGLDAAGRVHNFTSVADPITTLVQQLGLQRPQMVQITRTQPPAA